MLILSLAVTLALALLLCVALFDVDALVEKLMFAVIVALALGAAGLVHLAATPTRQLAHPDKVRREQRHAATVTGVLFGILLLLASTAAFDLNSWAEWTCLGALVVTAVGAGIAVQTRMR